jgi:hypothetical protein
MISKIILSDKFIIVSFIMLGVIFGSVNNILIDEEYFYVLVIFESLIAGFLMLNWYVVDSLKLGQKPNVLISILILLGYPIILPIYFISTRSLMKGSLYSLILFAVIALHLGGHIGSDYIIEHTREKNTNEELVLNFDASTLKAKKMEEVVNYYKKIVSDGSTPYIIVDSKLRNVVVPTQFSDERGYVVLDISPGALRDIKITDFNISFYAAFGGNVMNVVATTESILAIYYSDTGEGITF